MALMERALAHAGHATVALYATDAGRGLYAKLGFVEVGATLRLSGRAAAGTETAHAGLRVLCAEDHEKVRALDRYALGVPRRRLLDVLLDTAHRAYVIERERTIVAYGLASIHDGARMLAPIVAEDTRDARALASALASDAEGLVRVDLAPGETALRAWGEEVGLVPEATSLFMVRGARMPGARGLVRALAGRAFG